VQGQVLASTVERTKRLGYNNSRSRGHLQFLPLTFCLDSVGPALLGGSLGNPRLAPSLATALRVAQAVLAGHTGLGSTVLRPSVAKRKAVW